MNVSELSDENIRLPENERDIKCQSIMWRTRGLFGIPVIPTACCIWQRFHPKFGRNRRVGERQTTDNGDGDRGDAVASVIIRPGGSGGKLVT